MAAQIPEIHSNLAVESPARGCFTPRIAILRRLVFLLCVSGGISISGAQEGIIPILITTEMGEIEAALDSSRAPETVKNFLRYLDAGQYDGGAFHRTVTLDNQPNSPVKIEVIQAAINPAFADTSYPPKSGYPAVPLERTDKTGLRHQDGAVSMARLGPDTATSGFFICIGDQPELDFGGKRNPDGQGFAAFGHVARGMEVVKRIQQSPRQEQRLVPPVKILRIERKPEIGVKA
jgi:peptidyl-prolyl cis-trans isomerase A (cyclophilin A)